MNTEAIAIIVGFIGITIVSMQNIYNYAQKYEEAMKENKRLKRRLDDAPSAGYLANTQSTYVTNDYQEFIGAAGQDGNATIKAKKR